MSADEQYEEMVRRRDARVAQTIELAREATAAGLVVVQMVSMPDAAGRLTEYALALYTPDGELWVEGGHETVESIRAHIVRWMRRGGRPAPAVKPHLDGPQDRGEAVSMLAHYALSCLWAESDFQPGGLGCCHVCCAPCAALYYLERMGLLDVTVRAWPEGMRGSDMFVADRVDRAWLFRQWSGSKVQEQCGHRLDPPAEGWTNDWLPAKAGWPGQGSGGRR